MSTSDAGARRGTEATIRRPTVRWAGVALGLVFGWVAGRFVWGGPEEPGTFGDVWFWSGPLFVLVPALPAMVISGLLLRIGWRRLGLAALAVSALGTSWALVFAHFGGFCLDPGEDVCNVTWGSRLTALAAGLVAVVLGFLCEVAPARRHRQSSTP